MQRQRTQRHKEKIIIAGTGRAGTTFLVQLFTALNFDTGFSLGDIGNVDGISHAGLERPIRADGPYVIKSPWISVTLETQLRQAEVEIHAAIIAVRDLFAAAQSRRRVYRKAHDAGLDPKKHPGSLWLTEKPSEQEDVLVRKFYDTVIPLIEHQIETYFVYFPRLAYQAEYLFKCLCPLMEEHDVGWEEFHHHIKESRAPS